MTLVKGKKTNFVRVAGAQVGKGKKTKAVRVARDHSGK